MTFWRKWRLTRGIPQVGKKLQIHRGIIIKGRHGLQIGSHVHINDYVWIHAIGGVTIGNNVLIGPRAIIHSANHRYIDDKTIIRDQGHDYKAVTIGNDVWIGAGAIILPGVTIGDGAVVGAGAVVTNNVPPYHVVVGVPAHSIRVRGEVT